MIKRSDYQLPGGRSGVLLIHGLTGTPTEMRFVAKGLNRNGFTVHAMQLAGHCGDEADLLKTGWRDWYQSVCRAADRLRSEVDHMFVAGLSMGALLALKLAADRPDQVDGLGLYGTTFFYDGWTIPWIGRLSFMLPLVCGLGFGWKQRFHECFPYGIKDERIRNIIAAVYAGDATKMPEKYGYSEFPGVTIRETFRLIKNVRSQLGRIIAPLLIVHATEDDMASPANAQFLAERVASSEVETFFVDDSYHVLTLDRKKDEVAERLVSFFRQQAPTNHADHT